MRVTPREVVTDSAPVCPAVLEGLVPSARHHVERYANNPIEADRAQLKRRLRPMRGLQHDRTAQVVIAGDAFVQNLRRGHPARRRGTYAAIDGSRPSVNRQMTPESWLTKAAPL